MDPKAAKVAIGLPVYNGEKHLDKAIESLLSQTYNDFELIISDNQSSDRTAEICRDYASQDARIRYICQEKNLGSVGNFNFVFRASNHQYFKWAAYDDICAPSFLEECVNLLDANSDVIWCHSRSIHIDIEGQPLPNESPTGFGYIFPGQPHRGSDRASTRFSAIVLGGSSMMDSYGLYRSETLRKTGLYLPYFGSEKILLAELALHGRYAEVDQPLFFPRVHDAAAGALQSAAQQQAFCAPDVSGSFVRAKLLQGYIAAISRAKVPFVERIRCYWTLLGYLFQLRKWGKVVSSVLFGFGLTDKHRRLRQNDAVNCL